MKLQIISDIHLEFLKYYPEIQPLADIIALLGDIGNPAQGLYWSFIKNLSKKFKHVLVILGNHEYYGNDARYFTNCLREKAKQFNNVHFLENSTFQIENYKFIGSTLWSYIPEDKKMIIASRINDFKLIKSEGTKITPEIVNQWHQTAVAFIEQEIETSEVAVIVLTHHCPLSIPEVIGSSYQNSKINNAFYTDLSRLIKKPVVLWCYGHTHFNANLVFNGVTVCSNQLGYDTEKTGYKLEYVVDI